MTGRKKSMSDETTTNTLTEIIRLQEQSKALSEKLTQQGNDIHSLRNELQKSQAPDLRETRTRLDAYEAKTSEIAANLKEIAADLKASQKPKWGLYISSGAHALDGCGWHRPRVLDDAKHQD